MITKKLLIVLLIFLSSYIAASDMNVLNNKTLKYIFDISKNNDLEGAKKLLTDQPNIIHCKYTEGHTILNIAAAHACVDIVKLSLGYGAKVDDEDTKQNTALFLGVTNPIRSSEQRETQNRIDTVRVLLKHGADVNKKNHGNYTALIAAVKRKYQSITALLLKRGAKTDIQDTKCGNTALMVAAEFDNADGAKALLLHGARTDLKNKNNKTALDLARDKGHWNIAQIIEDHVNEKRVQEHFQQVGLDAACSIQ